MKKLKSVFWAFVILAAGMLIPQMSKASDGLGFATYHTLVSVAYEFDVASGCLTEIVTEYEETRCPTFLGLCWPGTEVIGDHITESCDPY